MHTNPEVLALLALGEDSGTPDERSHVESCPLCSRELDELAHLAGVGRKVENAPPLESPSPEVWHRIQAELGISVAPAAIPASAAPEPRAVPETGRRRSRRLLSLALAAALALIVGIGVGLGWNRLAEPTPTVIGEAQLQPTPAWAGATGEATLERDPDGQRVLVVRVSTPREVDGTRVVWIMDPTFKRMQTVGQLTGSEGRFTIEPRTNLADFPVVDISDEPLDDPEPRHSGATIVRGSLNI